MVALTPESVRRLTADGQNVWVQCGAGSAAGWSDDLYQQAGASLVDASRDMLESVDLVVSVEAERDDWHVARPGTAVVGLLRPFTAPLERFEVFQSAGLSALSLDSLPRISRAQSMDVLSSFSTVMGYRAVVVAAERLRHFFPLLMTAAGTIPPARVLVLGAGVAGLQAIATAHRLGAVVEAFDTRPEVREQVESLGASFLTVDVQSRHTQDGYATELEESQSQRESDSLADPVARADVIITTAQIPGQTAPVLITTAMLQRMKRGSVIVDLAAESGGNTEQTQLGREIDFEGVLILGPERLAFQLPRDASQLLSRNITNFLLYLSHTDWAWDSDHRVILPDDDLVLRTLVVHQGVVRHSGLEKRMAEGGAHHISRR